MSKHNDYSTEKMLIWGKTYPELSTRHLETVCTGAITEDGRIVRLYPIPFRFLEGNADGFSKYQWITASIAKSNEDIRPESYKINYRNIVLHDAVPPDSKGWEARSKIMFKNKDWQVGSLEELHGRQKENGMSIGCLKPKDIVSIEVVEESKEKLNARGKKLDEIKKMITSENLQDGLFEQSTIKSNLLNLEYYKRKVRIKFQCDDVRCNGHDISILDWEVAELLRREGSEKLIAKLSEVLTSSKYDSKLFFGNMKSYPTSFVIVGIWYPIKYTNTQLSLID